MDIVTKIDVTATLRKLNVGDYVMLPFEYETAVKGAQYELKKNEGKCYKHVTLKSGIKVKRYE